MPPPAPPLLLLPRSGSSRDARLVKGLEGDDDCAVFGHPFRRQPASLVVQVFKRPAIDRRVEQMWFRLALPPREQLATGKPPQPLADVGRDGHDWPAQSLGDLCRGERTAPGCTNIALVVPEAVEWQALDDSVAGVHARKVSRALLSLPRPSATRDTCL